MRERCTSNKAGRNLTRGPLEGYLDRVRAYAGTYPYEKALRKRKVWTEPLFAEAKDWHGLRKFRLRRLEKVNIEALLIASGQNIKRLVNFRDRGPRFMAQAAALRPPEPLFHSRCYYARMCYRYMPRCSSRRRGFSTGSNVFDTALKRWWNA